MFQLEYYLTCVISANYRKVLTKLRVSCLHLAIETGRYHKPSSLPVEQRLCSACNLIEDEVHLLCTCTHNAHIRREFFNLVGRVYPHFESPSRIEKFILLMQTHDPYVIAAFGCSISVLLLAYLTQLHFRSDVTLAYESFFTGSQIACLSPSLADAVEAEVLPIP